ncbi:hypothetical protein MUK42_07773 [Musa troglodytarum]|uniref:Uncharacterized protein n=1 Tax=Musa troglodytarum TaxID=320322 RepID=A0A9E7I6U5_9LILI|nr:hypothetical protein MUK42_07773 [Musa troglodytarum]
MYSGNKATASGPSAITDRKGPTGAKHHRYWHQLHDGNAAYRALLALLRAAPANKNKIRIMDEEGREK